MPSVPRAICPILLSGLLLTACSDDGSSQRFAGNTTVRFVAPIQFTACDVEYDICCVECPAEGYSPDPIFPCSRDTDWEPGDEWAHYMDLPPEECTFTAFIERGGITCEGSKTFQVETAGRTMVDMTVDCSE